MNSGRNKTVIVLACRRSGTKMISDCMFDAEILFGYSNIAGGKNQWSVPKCARWIMENGTIDNNTPIPLMNPTYVMDDYTDTMNGYLKYRDDEFILETIEDTGVHRITLINDNILQSNNGHSWDRPAVSNVFDIGINHDLFYFIGSVEKVFASPPRRTQDDVAISKLPQINADRLPRFARNDRFPGFSISSILYCKG